jgi:hypothetical protein
MRIFAAIALLALVIPLAQSQSPSKPHDPLTQKPAERAGVSSEDVQALRMDLQRMKALVQQMQTNLAFVTNTQGPLKHQFELEIEMWQVEIASMERRLGPGSDEEPKK